MLGIIRKVTNYPIDTCGDGGIAFTGLRKSGSKRLEIKGFRHFGVKADEGKKGH